MHRQDKKHFLLSDEYTLKTERRQTSVSRQNKNFYTIRESILLFELFFVHITIIFYLSTYFLINMQICIVNMLCKTLLLKKLIYEYQNFYITTMGQKHSHACEIMYNLLECNRFLLILAMSYVDTTQPVLAPRWILWTYYDRYAIQRSRKLDSTCYFEVIVVLWFMKRATSNYKKINFAQNWITDLTKSM